MTRNKRSIGGTVLGVFLIVPILCWTGWLRVTAQSGISAQRRTLSRLVLPKEPIEIREIRLKGGEIVVFSEKDAKTQQRSAEAFTDDEDWLAGLQGTFKNIYTTDITRLQIAVSIPRLDDPRQDLVVVVPFSRSKISLAPGEEITLKFSEKTYKAMRELLNSKGLTSITQAALTIDWAEFDDGTAWRVGKFFQRNPDDHNRWDVIGIEKILKEKGISFNGMVYNSNASHMAVFRNKPYNLNASPSSMLQKVVETKAFKSTPHKLNTSSYDCAFIVSAYSWICGDDQDHHNCYVFDDWLYYHYDGDVYTGDSNQQCQVDGDCCCCVTCFPRVIRGRFPSECWQG